MNKANGTQTAVAPVVEAPAGNGVQEALAALLQSSRQTNQTLAQLVQEIGLMNHQMFAGGQAVRAYQPPAQPTAPSPAPAQPVARVVPDGQQWRKEIYKSRCSSIGISKTRSLNKWKLNFYVDGYYRPASAYSRMGIASLIQLARGVWPEISEDHFSNETFNQRNQEWQNAGNDNNYEEMFTAPQPFAVEWYEKPGNDGRTYAYVERVYPIGGEIC
ncbi:MAG: hypothetical protein JW953_01435 [Anaerolineae bacterium]|nr:hypothetical protein [Anaerolineae bacterium]